MNQYNQWWRIRDLPHGELDRAVWQLSKTAMRHALLHAIGERDSVKRGLMPGVVLPRLRMVARNWAWRIAHPIAAYRTWCIWRRRRNQP